MQDVPRALVRNGRHYWRGATVPTSAVTIPSSVCVVDGPISVLALDVPRIHIKLSYSPDPTQTQEGDSGACGELAASGDGHSPSRGRTGRWGEDSRESPVALTPNYP